MMAFLLSKPDNWEINVQNLIKQSKDGKEAVYSAINELITFGYIVLVISSLIELALLITSWDFRINQSVSIPETETEYSVGETENHETKTKIQ